jgi:nucleoside-triphosphatase
LRPSGPPPRHRGLLGLAALACIGVQVPGSLVLSALALALWLGLLAAFDRISLRRLWMPRFWVITLIFALASGLLLGPKATGGTGAILSPEGLQAGLLMVLRGAFIFALASWASRALAGETLKRAAARVGLARLGTALSTALQLLPELKDRLLAQAQKRKASTRWRKLQRFPELAVEVICETARLAAEIAGPAREARRPLRVAITGAPGAGKTTLVGDLLRRLRQRGLQVGGVTQPAILEGDRRAGYQLRDERTGEERPFARRREKRDEAELGFSFDADAWPWAATRIARARREADVVVVDELGRLEARGEGHLPSLVEPLEHERARVLILSVRADRARDIEERLGAFDRQLAVGADAATRETLVDEIVRLCAQSAARAATSSADAPSAC